MRGNVYISIPAADKDKHCRQQSHDTIGTNTPTMKKVKLNQPQQCIQRGRNTAKSTKRILVRPYRLMSDVEYIVYEITASWKDSEVSALLALGNRKAAPKYTVMTAEEARQFIADNADAQL